MKWIEKAENLINSIFKNNPDEIEKACKVSKLSVEIAKKFKVDEVHQDIISAAAMVHNIGISEQLNVTGFAPVDSFNYLKENGWCKNIQDVALYNSQSEKIASSTRRDVFNVYLENSQCLSSLLMTDIISYAKYLIYKNEEPTKDFPLNINYLNYIKEI